MKTLLARAALLTLSVLAPLAPCSAAQPPGRIEQGSFTYDGIAPPAAADEDPLSRYLEWRSASFMGWLADGSLLITTRFANTAQLHRLRAPLGAREQLSFHAAPVLGALAHPAAGETLLWLQDHDGDGNTQIWLRNLRDGSERRLTDGRSRNDRPVWGRDGRRIAFASNARDGLGNDIYIVDTTAATPAPQLVLAGSRETQLQDWSMDDSRLLLIRRTSGTSSELLLGDVATGNTTRIEPDAKTLVPVNVTQARFSRDGRGLFYLSDHGGEFTGLRYVDMFTGEGRVLAPQARFDVQRFELSVDGRYIAYTLNEGAADRLVLHDLAQQADLLLPPLPAGAIVTTLGFDPRSEHLAVTLETATTPGDVYVYTLNAGTPQLARWTHSELGPLDASTLIDATAIEFPTWDRVDNRQRALPAFVYRPRTAGPHPVLIDLQGAADAQFRPRWNAFTQYLVNELGYTVVAPNLRGAAGYGRSFAQLDDGALREDAIRDIGSLLVWIGLQTDLDRNRVLVMGAPGGGYLALASLVHYGDRLVGGIDVVDGGPRIPSVGSGSPINRPLLLVQGLNDPRAPPEAATPLLQLRTSGAEVAWFAVRDEGRDFAKKTSRDAWLATAAQFLRRWK